MAWTPSFPSTTAQHAAVARPQRLVVDAPTRMFHWLFALSFLGAYLSADSEHWRLLHVTLGYTMAALLVFRVLYGWLGPRQASLGLVWRKLAGGPAWLRQALASQSVAQVNWRQGQNLLMALAVLALMVLVLPLTLSGYGAYADWADVLGGDWLEELHGLLGEALWLVVLGHLALIVGLSLLRRKNQAQAMLTGRLDGAGPDLVQHNRRWLAAALLMAVLVFAGLVYRWG